MAFWNSESGELYDQERSVMIPPGRVSQLVQSLICALDCDVIDPNFQLFFGPHSDVYSFCFVSPERTSSS